MLAPPLFAETNTPADATMADRLVRITATYQNQNPFQPWQYQAPAIRTGYGVIVAPGEVLTTEHLVRNHTHVELLRPRTGEKTPVTVTIADPRLNLALLKLPASAVRPIAPIPIAGPLRLRDSVSVAQFDDGNDLQLTDAAVSQIAVSGLPEGPYSLLSCQLLVQINVDGEGAPVLYSNALAGIINTYQPSARIAAMATHPFIARFLEDAHAGPYAGPASGGFLWKPLVDPAKRAWLRLAPEPRGIQVISVMRGAPAEGTLKPRDVVLAWDGHPLDELGYYVDPDYGRTEFSHLVKGKGRPGDRVPIDIWRDGAAQTVELTLGADPDAYALVPENVSGTRAPYLVSGGFVFRELDVYLLRAYGQDWRGKADPQLLHFYTDGLPDQKPGDRIVVVTGVLPDIINIGYQHLLGRVVTALNGSPVRNMRDVFEIADRDELIDRITLKGIGVDLVLDREELAAANGRLARQYRIAPMEFRGDPPRPAAAEAAP